MIVNHLPCTIDCVVINMYNDLLQIDTLLACGGLSKNSLFIQEHADITGTPFPCFVFNKKIYKSINPYYVPVPHTIVVDFLLQDKTSLFKSFTEYLVPNNVLN